jgi:hypothetical protein
MNDLYRTFDAYASSSCCWVIGECGSSCSHSRRNSLLKVSTCLLAVIVRRCHSSSKFSSASNGVNSSFSHLQKLFHVGYGWLFGYLDVVHLLEVFFSSSRAYRIQPSVLGVPSLIIVTVVGVALLLTPGVLVSLVASHPIS